MLMQRHGVIGRASELCRHKTLQWDFKRYNISKSAELQRQDSAAFRLTSEKNSGLCFSIRESFRCIYLVLFCTHLTSPHLYSHYPLTLSQYLHHYTLKMFLRTLLAPRHLVPLPRPLRHSRAALAGSWPSTGAQKTRPPLWTMSAAMAHTTLSTWPF